MVKARLIDLILLQDGTGREGWAEGARERGRDVERARRPVAWDYWMNLTEWKISEVEV